MPRSDLNAASVFAKVVSTGSFTRAARELGMPKSTVSRKVAELEERLGARLLQRTTRKLNLTEVGRTFYRHAARAVSEIETAEQAVMALEQAPRGRLRVSAPPDLEFLGPICAEFLRDHPEVHLELVGTDRIVDLVEEAYDVAIRAGPLVDSSLRARRLMSWEGFLVASPRYLEQRGAPTVPEQLVTHDCIAFGTGSDRIEWTLRSGRKTASVQVLGRFVTNDFRAMGDALAAGVGIAVMPAFRCTAEVLAGRLSRVLPEWSAPEESLHAVYPSHRQVSPKVTAFVELLRARLASPS